MDVMVDAAEAAEAADAAPRVAPADDAASPTTVYRPRHPLDLRATLAPLGRGPADPTTRWDAAGVWRTFRTPHGAATLRLEQCRDEVHARAWGPGAEAAIVAVPDLLGARDDHGPLDDRGHRVLREAVRRNPGLRLARTGRLLEALIPAILEQKVTSVEAFRSWAALVRAFGEPAPGPVEGMRVAPSAETWRRIPSWRWHRAGVDPRRTRTALEACRRASALERLTGVAGGAGSDGTGSDGAGSDGTGSDGAGSDGTGSDGAGTDRAGCAAGAGVPGAEARRRLQSIPGIGVWTAAEAVQRSHGDPDAVSVGDYNLCGYVGTALVGSPVDDDGMLELLAPWEGRRQLVVRMLLAAGLRIERHGPRATIQDHRHH